MKKGIIIVLISLISILIGLNNVNASTYTESIVFKGIRGTTITNQDQWPLVGDYWTKTITSNNNLTTYTMAFDDNTKTYLKNYDYISFNLIYTKPNPYTEYTNYDIGPSLCIGYTCGDLQGGVCRQWGCDATINQDDEEIIVKNFNFDQFNFNVRVIDDNYNWYSCTINGNEVMCPTNNQNVKQIRLDVYFNTTETRTINIAITRNFKLYNRDNVSDAINNQTNIINNTLNGNQNYDKEASEEVNGKEEINDYTEKEEQLFSNLNFEGIGNNEIVINPNTSTFIWQIIARLRGMNGKIVLLMTSILGLGIIKMVLNR